MWEKARFDNWRLRIMSLFLLSILIIGLPVWWHLTKIYRAPLPISEILSSVQAEHPSLVITLKVVILTTNTLNIPQLEKTLTLNMKKYVKKDPGSQKYRMSWNTSVEVSPMVVPSGHDDLKLDLFFFSLCGEGVPGVYSFFVFLDDDGVLDAEVTLGMFRHGWVKTKSIEQDWLTKTIFPIIPTIFHTNLGISENSEIFSSEFRERQSMIQIKPAPTYRLSFRFMNANPISLFGWNFQEISETHLFPFLEKISEIANFSVVSQVVHYCEIEKKPIFDTKEKLFYYTKEFLPYFIDKSDSRNLDFFSDAKKPSLNFVVYVPNPNQSPLKIRNSDGKFSKNRTFGWIIPQWGGVVILNPEMENITKRGILRDEEIYPVLKIFVTQLRELLGIPEPEIKLSMMRKKISESSPMATLNLLPSPSTALTSWELDNVIFYRLSHFQEAAATTLLQFHTLVQKLPMIPVHDHISHLMTSALQNLQESYRLTHLGNYSEAFSFSKRATDEAELAFFDSEMIAMLYFPDNHKYAIYVPLFLPLMFPFIGGFRREWKRYRLKKRVPVAKPRYLRIKREGVIK